MGAGVGHAQLVITSGGRSRRWVLAGLAMAVAVLLLVAGLWYGVEELVWDSAHQSYTYQERPLATVVAWLGAVLATVTAAWGLRVLTPDRTPHREGPVNHPICDGRQPRAPERRDVHRGTRSPVHD